jgi:hypothetical protein
VPVGTIIIIFFGLVDKNVTSECQGEQIWNHDWPMQPKRDQPVPGGTKLGYVFDEVD